MTALCVWGGEKNVPALLKLLDSSKHDVQWTAILALGQISKDPEVAEALAQRLGSDPAVSTALTNMGPVAERFVIPSLRNKDDGVRRAACMILSAIGGAASIEALQAAQQDLGSDAKQVIESIKKRQAASQGTKSP
jgi:HEAT repeat protein